MTSYSDKNHQHSDHTEKRRQNVLNFISSGMSAGMAANKIQTHTSTNQSHTLA